MIMRQDKSDQKHSVARRPRIAAVRIGEKSTARPSTMSDYAHEMSLVSSYATGLKCAVLNSRPTNVNGWTRANLLVFLIRFLTSFRAYGAVGLARHKVEAAPEDIVFGHCIELHTEH